jgi:hypothetical protein
MASPETHPFVVPCPVVHEALPVVVVMKRAHILPRYQSDNSVLWSAPCTSIHWMRLSVRYLLPVSVWWNKEQSMRRFPRRLRP